MLVCLPKGMLLRLDAQVSYWRHKIAILGVDSISMPSIHGNNLLNLLGTNRTCRCVLVAWRQWCSDLFLCLQFWGSLALSVGPLDVLLWFTYRLLFARVWRSLSLLMKWWMEGMASPRWINWPMFCSISFAVDDSSSIIYLIDIIHALNLLSGSWISSRRQPLDHPRMVFCSSSSASEWSLFLASITLQGMGLFGLRGLEHVSNAMRGARSHLSKLSVSLMSTASKIKSSM